MKNLLNKGFILVLLIFSSIICHAQPNSNYFQDFVIANHKVYVFHADGILKIFDENSGKLLDTYSPKPKIRLLTQDHNGFVIIADSDNNVKRLSPENKWTQISYYQGALYKVVFDNDNDCFLITDKGILNVKNQKTYLPGKELFHSEWAYHGNYTLESDNNIETYVDKDSNIWFSFWHGEWGSDMFIWSTKELNFIPFKNWFAMPVYEANGHLFAITGNFHDEYLVQYDKIYDKNQKVIGFVGSEVYSTEKDPTYQQAADKIYNKAVKPKAITAMDIKNFYVGGFTFNPVNGKMYVISSEGLLVADHLPRNLKFGDLTSIKSFIFPKNITKAYLYYHNEKHETIFDNGYPQSISKLQFTKSGKLVLLAPFNGVWLFDGKKLIIME